MREVDEAARHGVASARHDELLQRLHRAEDALQATTKGYILGAHAEISHMSNLTSRVLHAAHKPCFVKDYILCARF